MLAARASTSIWSPRKTDALERALALAGAARNWATVTALAALAAD